jgi:hypothetical protein
MSYFVTLSFLRTGKIKGALSILHGIAEFVAMEPSPLTQDVRPDSFQPKIIRLYEALFRVGAELSLWLEIG